MVEQGRGLWGAKGAAEALVPPSHPTGWPKGAGNMLFAWQAGQGAVGAERESWRGLTGHERSGEPLEGVSWVSVCVCVCVCVFRIVFGDQSNSWRKYGLRGKTEGQDDQIGGCGHFLVTHANAVSWGREGGMMAKKGSLDAVSRAMKQAWKGVE